MLYGIIWADRAAPRGVESTMSYEELAIVTTRKTCKKNANRKQLSKAYSIEGSHIIKTKIGEHWS